MRYFAFVSLLSLFILISVIGCSRERNSNPVVPQGDKQPIASSKDDGHSVIASGVFEIDPAKMEVRENPDRDVSLHKYLNPYLAGYVRYKFLYVNPPYYTIEITIENPTSLQVYDVRAIYTGLHGKEIMNPDGFTNFLDPAGDPPYNPFHYFAKSYPRHAFPVGPGGKDSQIMELYWPDGAPSWVNYAIECSIGGNAEEPISIDEVKVDGTITPIGGGIVVLCDVDDWQDDISNVSMLCTDLFRDPIQFHKKAISKTWFGQFLNLDPPEPGTGIFPGDYKFWIKAESPNPDNIALWMPFTVTVLDTMDYAPKFTDYPVADPDVLMGEQVSVLDSNTIDATGDDLSWLWEQISPLDLMGEYGAGGNTAENPEWIAPILSIEGEYFIKVGVTEASGMQTSCAFLSMVIEPSNPPQITYGPLLIPNPILEMRTGQFSVHAIDPDNPYDPSPSLSYFWTTVEESPGKGGGWENQVEGQTEKCPRWIAPSINTDSNYKFRVIVRKGQCVPALLAEADVDVVVENSHPPEIVAGPIFIPNPIFENNMGQFSIHCKDPDNPFEEFPALSYFWLTIEPSGQGGTWQYGERSQVQKCPRWIAPEVNGETLYTFHVIVTKDIQDPTVTTHAELEVYVEDTEG